VGAVLILQKGFELAHPDHISYQNLIVKISLSLKRKCESRLQTLRCILLRNMINECLRSLQILFEWFTKLCNTSLVQVSSFL